MIILWSYMIPWGLCSKYLFLCLYYDTTIFSTTIPPRMQGLRWHYNSTIILLRLLESCAAAIFLPGLRPHYDSTTISLRFWESTSDYLYLLVLWPYYYDFTTIILGWYYYCTTVLPWLYYNCTIVSQAPPPTMGGCLNPLRLAVCRCICNARNSPPSWRVGAQWLFMIHIDLTSSFRTWCAFVLVFSPPSFLSLQDV